jgi:predicted TIM-barrel fold metal-dependent hydrolase
VGHGLAASLGPAEIMPDDGHLLDLFYTWTPDEHTRRHILVETPMRLFGI